MWERLAFYLMLGILILYAVDAERGFRNQDDATREMDEIENEIREIITDVRRVAGRPTSSPETGTVREREREKVG